MADARRPANLTQTAFPHAQMAFAFGDARFAEAITVVHANEGRPILVGLCGAQGSGKSSTAARLCALLARSGLVAVACSIDDFYLTRGERQGLADQVHPLLATRGVPGTHDVALMARTIDTLLAAGQGDTIAIPVFDKAGDDRAPQQDGASISALPMWSCSRAGALVRARKTQLCSRSRSTHSSAKRIPRADGVRL